LLRLLIEYLKIQEMQDSRNLYFLLHFQLSDLTQDIVVRQFDSSAFIKAYIIGVSI